MNINEYATDETYGYAIENPIKVGGALIDGPDKEWLYLDALAGPAGEKISYRRRGSRRASDDDGGPTDIYEITYKGVDTPIVLYINMYDSDVLKVPVGFTLKEIDKITLILTGQVVELEFEANEDFTIDWGDGSVTEHCLSTSEEYTEDDIYFTYTHEYPNENERTIVITGNDIAALTCRDIQITNLDISKNSSLVELDCTGNKLTSLDISNTGLIQLDCAYNQLTSLDISNTNLSHLNCQSNQLTHLDVSYTELTGLFCSFNQLTNLDVSCKTNLTHLGCMENQLTQLDVSKNTMLRKLYCGGNQLTDLDVSYNTKLTHLDCASNQLTNLSIDKNCALEWLYCNNNPLTSLDVSKNSALSKFEHDDDLKIIR